MGVKRKIPNPCQESNPRTPIIQPIAQHYNGKQKWTAVPLVRGVTDEKHKQNSKCTL
jgi:hypothetical protein